MLMIADGLALVFLLRLVKQELERWYRARQQVAGGGSQTSEYQSINS